MCPLGERNAATNAPPGIRLSGARIAGCTTTRHLDPPTVIARDGGTGRNRIVGATLKDGREMRFDASSSTRVTADTLRTSVAKQATLIPLADLHAVWVKSTDARKTTLLLVVL